MKRLVFILCMCLLFVLSKNSTAQSGSEIAYSLDQVIEILVEETEEDIDVENLTEELYAAASSPINLNGSNLNKLAELQIINQSQLKNLERYIRRNKQIRSLYELQLIEGLQMNDIKKLLPFVTIGTSTSSKPFNWRYLHKGHGQVYARFSKVLNDQEGYLPIDDSSYAANPNSRYLGQQFSLNTKITYRVSNKIHLGLRTDKDAGEELFSGSNKNGFDYYSAHLEMNEIGIVKKINLGDFNARFGQGLTLWTGFPMFKSSQSTTNTKRFQSGINKYSGSNENQFFRGAAITLAFKNFELATFYSKKRRDANIKSDSTTSEEAFISSLQETGIHATPGQLEDKHSVNETSIGGNLNYKNKLFRLGLTAVAYQLDKQFISNETPESLYDFRGNKSFNVGIDYQFRFLNFNIFGETAINEQNNPASINGILFSPASNISLSLVNRYYPKSYYGLYQGAFGEGSDNNDENGTYLGISLHPFRQVQINAYYDIYAFHWLKYNSSSPSRGTDYSVQVSFAPGKQLDMYARYKTENSEVDQTNSDAAIAKLAQRRITSFRYNLRFQAGSNISLQSRIEYKHYCIDQQTANGMLVLQDIKYAFEKAPLSLSYRFAIFDTDDYNARIYSYENDVLYSFTFPAYYAKGTRWYLMLKYSFGASLDCWIRVAQTYYYNKSLIGSGLNQIDGNSKMDLKVVANYRF